MEATAQTKQIAAAVKPVHGHLAKTQKLREIYRRLSVAWGPQHWWPAESPFEVIVGAILTQNTSWTNVELALGQLRTAGVLSVEGIRTVGVGELEQLIRSSGYFRQKAERLKAFVAFVDERYSGSVERMLQQPTSALRGELLALKGIGPETADSMLLYAGNHPMFVVDAYTRRVLERHEVVAEGATYDEIRKLVEDALHGETAAGSSGSNPSDNKRPAVHAPSNMSEAVRCEQTQVFNEMHGLMVQLGKHYCAKRSPKCEVCPLMDLLSNEMSEALRMNEASKAKNRGAVKPRPHGRSRL